MQEPKPGATVYVTGKVLRAYGFDREEAYHTVELQLPDGQHLATNVKNLVEPVEETAQAQSESPTEEKKQTKTKR